MNTKIDKTIIESSFEKLKYVEKEVLNHYKNVHKMWNGNKWKLEYIIIYDDEKSHTFENKLDDTYTVFRFDENEKLTRYVLYTNSYELEGRHYSYTREEKEMCYDDDLHKTTYKFSFEWSYPYLTEILKDENGVKIIESKRQIIDDKKYRISV